MYVNEKMRPAETITGMEVGRIKENDRRDGFKYDIFVHCKNFCKCHNVPIALQKRMEIM
jgi:hypothetical protein